MSWPDDYEDRFAVCQRLVRILHAQVQARDLKGLVAALAKDSEASVEYAAALGSLDALQTIIDDARTGYA